MASNIGGPGTQPIGTAATLAAKAAGTAEAPPATPASPADQDPAQAAADQVALQSPRPGYAAAPGAPAAAPPTTDKAAVQPMLDQISALLGSGVSFASEGKALWSTADAQALLGVVERMGPADRAALAKARFERVTSLGTTDHGTPDHGQILFGGTEAGSPLTIKFADVATAPGVFQEVAAHEIGHAVMGKGRWDSNAIREFGKLSHWTDADGGFVDGYDKAHRPISEDPGAKPHNSTNLVSEYAHESAVEDYAESYRTYLLHPEELMAKAPDKFLYLNAEFGRYKPADVQAYAAGAGADLPIVMAEFRRSNLRPDTIDRIAKAHLLIGAGEGGTAAGDAVARIQAGAGDARFVDQLRTDPRGALGEDIWNRLSSPEQALLSRADYVDKVLATVGTHKIAPPDKRTDAEVSAFERMFTDIVTVPPDDSTKLAMSDAKVLGIFPVSDNPQRARSRYFWDRLHDPQYSLAFSQEARAAIDSESGRKVISQLSNEPPLIDAMSKVWGGVKVLWFNVGPKQDKAAVANAVRAAEDVGVSEVDNFVDLLKSGPGADVVKFAASIATLIATGSLPTGGFQPYY